MKHQTCQTSHPIYVKYIRPGGPGRRLSLEENGGFLALPLLMFSNASLALSNYFILVDDKEMYPE